MANVELKEGLFFSRVCTPSVGVIAPPQTARASSGIDQDGAAAEADWATSCIFIEFTDLDAAGRNGFRGHLLCGIFDSVSSDVFHRRS